MKRQSKPTALNTQANTVPPTADQKTPQTSSEKKTFLPIDAILYPKESSTSKLEKIKKMRAKQGISKNHELAGLKGFGKAASRVSMLINEK